MKKSIRQKKLNQAKEGVVKDTAAEIVRAVATTSNKDEDTLWREMLSDPKSFAKDYKKFLTDGQRKFLNTESAKQIRESCDCTSPVAVSEEDKEPGKYQMGYHYQSHSHRVTINEYGCGESNVEEGHSHLVTDWEVQAVAEHTHHIGYRLDESTGILRFALLKASGKQRLNESKSDEEDFEMTQWSQPAPGIFFPAGQVTKKLPPGYYSIESSMQGPYFKRRDIKTESLLRFPDSNSDRVIDEIDNFWKLEERFKENGIPYRRGIVLYGSPGGGKSVCCRIVVEDVVREHGGIVVDFPDSSSRFIEGYKVLRSIQPNVPLVVLMEDLDATLRYGESSVLNLLDGMHNIHRVVWLATSNYPEKLGSRIMNRPSRFDKKFHIGMPNAEAREMYVRSKLKKIEETTEDEIKRWVRDTDGMSIAHIKELFVATKILGDSYEDAIKTLQAMKVTPSSGAFDDYTVENWAKKKPILIKDFCEAVKQEKINLLLEEHAPQKRGLDTVRLEFYIKDIPTSIVGRMTAAQRKKMLRYLEMTNPKFDTVEDLITHVEYLTGVRMVPFKWILMEKFKSTEAVIQSLSGKEKIEYEHAVDDLVSLYSDKDEQDYIIAYGNFLVRAGRLPSPKDYDLTVAKAVEIKQLVSAIRMQYEGKKQKHKVYEGDELSFKHTMQQMAKDRTADVPKDLLRHYDSGVKSAVLKKTWRADPFFALASDETFRVVFNDGAKGLVTFWGSTDGWGATWVKESVRQKHNSVGESTQRHCHTYLASNGLWYLELGHFEHATKRESSTYGPFRTEDAIWDYIHANHSNPGGGSFDDSGKQKPPRKGPDGRPVIQPRSQWETELYEQDLKQPSNREIDHEMMRIQSMGPKVMRRVRTIKKPQKMFTFALALEMEGMSEEANMAWKALRAMGYTPTGKAVRESVRENTYPTPDEPETLDDILDNILRKMIVTGSIDAIQDVDFADESHSVYLFLDAQMTEEEVSKLQEVINGLYQGTAVVASPDGNYPENSEPADWWVIFVPQESMAGQMGMPFPPMWGGQEPVVSPLGYVPADAIADIAQGVNVDTAVSRMLKSEAVQEAKEGVRELYSKIPMPQARQTGSDALYVSGYLGTESNEIIFNRMLNKVAWHLGFKQFTKIPRLAAWSSPSDFAEATITVQLIPGKKRSPTALEHSVTTVFYVTEYLPGIMEKVRKTLKTALGGTGWRVTDQDPTESLSAGTSRSLPVRS